MPNLNIKFSGLFLWVPTEKAMYVLAPPTDKGKYAVEPHVSRLLLPGSPQLHDIGGMELTLTGDAIDDAAMDNHFDCSCDGGVVVEELLIKRQEAVALQNRFVLGAGKLTKRHAPIEFYIGGAAKQCIASELTWCYPIAPGASRVTLSFNRLSSGMPAMAPITLQTIGGEDIDIEIHHVPPDHLPGGSHSHGPVHPFQLAKHLPALYNLLTDYRTITIPLTVGTPHVPAAAFVPPSGGGDPVTCGQGAGRPKATRSPAAGSERDGSHDSSPAPVPVEGA